MNSIFVQFQLTSKARPLVKLDEQVENSIQAQAIKPRNHPGRLKIKTVVLPDKLVKAVECVTQGIKGYE